MEKVALYMQRIVEAERPCFVEVNGEIHVMKCAGCISDYFALLDKKFRLGCAVTRAPQNNRIRFWKIIFSKLGTGKELWLRGKHISQACPCHWLWLSPLHAARSSSPHSPLAICTVRALLSCITLHDICG